jgi:putative glutamine amidotransferase
MMKPMPLVLVTAGFAKRGEEFSDASISLSDCYQEALLGVGLLPMIAPITADPSAIRECVRRSDGVMLTGGEDVDPRLYGARLPQKVKRTVGITPDGGKRDLRELLVIQEVFRQRKPLLAICRGHQLLNVALGGTLVADLPLQRPGPIHHRQCRRSASVVHDVRLTPDSFASRILAVQTLGVNSTHHQAVGKVAAPLVVAGKSSDGVVEILELNPRKSRMLPFLLSVQFHPERLVRTHKEHRRVFLAFAYACASGRTKIL